MMRVSTDSSTKMTGSTAGTGSCFVSLRRVSTMNMKNWTKGLVLTFAMSIASNLALANGGRSEEQEKKPTPATKVDSPKELTATSQGSGEDYVVVITDKDTTPLSVYQKYLDSADFW